MNLNQLIYFKTLAEYQHFTRAAKELFISQPSLSTSIKTLEKELHCNLIKKSGRNIELTAYGQLFYATTCEVISTLERGKKELQQKIDQNNGIIHVACIPTFIGSELQKIIKDFHKYHDSRTYFDLHDEFSYGVCEGGSKGTYDLGICSRMAEYQNLTFIPFLYQPIVVLVQKNNPLAKNKIITPAQLRDKEIVTYTDRCAIGHEIKQELEARCPHLNFVSDNIKDEMVIGGLVENNNSIGVTADTNFLDAFDLVKIPLDIPTDTHRMYITYDETREHSTSMDEFIYFLKKYKKNHEQQEHLNSIHQLN